MVSVVEPQNRPVEVSTVMKRIFIILILVIFCLLPPVTHAHMVGQPPFFQVNGDFTDFYPVPTTSLNDFNLPQDIAPKNFLAGETINFEIDESQLPVLPEVVKDTKFLWDFGDGERSEGLKNSHAYKKMGSYIVSIEAQYQQEQPQIIQTTLVNIVPDHSYKLPQAKLLVNGVEARDPLIDIIKVDFKKEVKFDSSKSEGNIKSITWDFGDGKSGNEPKPTYKYEIEISQLFPVLRVIDENGFISDTYVQLENTPGAGSAISGFFGKGGDEGGWIDKLKIPAIIGLVIVLVLGGIFLLKQNDGKKRSF
jgi:hypothetical protein